MSPRTCEIPGCGAMVPRRARARCAQHAGLVEDRPSGISVRCLCFEIGDLIRFEWTMSDEQRERLRELVELARPLVPLRNTNARVPEDLERFRQAHAFLAEHFPTAWWAS